MRSLNVTMECIIHKSDRIFLFKIQLLMIVCWKRFWISSSSRLVTLHDLCGEHCRASDQPDVYNLQCQHKPFGIASPLCSLGVSVRTSSSPFKTFGLRFLPHPPLHHILTVACTFCRSSLSTATVHVLHQSLDCKCEHHHDAVARACCAILVGWIRWHTHMQRQVVNEVAHDFSEA